METGMKKVFDSMENALRLQFQANAERRAAKAEQEEKEFRERLMQAAASKIELDAKASDAKGTQDAVRRDQLMALMMAGGHGLL
ncbi:MAG: hypothetical protein HFH39_10050 [Lachnospiraceae bacterium]|nr:hypothetical protein [Lachnospiraceae bacterium]